MMYYISISLLALVLLVGVVIALTWWVCEWWIYRKLRGEVMNMEKCPFKNPCLRYDEVESKAAVRRVAKLILENLEKEEKRVYEDLASGRLG